MAVDSQLIKEIIIRQREFFDSGNTRDIGFRLEQLKKLRQLIVDNEDRVYLALKSDLGRSESESYLGEFLTLKGELSLAISSLRKWSRKRKVPTSMVNQPARSYIMPEPYGVSLIISPWNYPFSISLAPVIASISAGNTIILKPSEHSVATSSLLEEMVNAYFEPGFFRVLTGGAELSQELLSNRFDYIFYTGGPEVGKLVMKSASEFLTPSTLELGGKSPCILNDSANLKNALRRILWGKFFNAGQTCVGVDYLLMNSSLKNRALPILKEIVSEFFGDKPEKSESFSRIINRSHFDRLEKMLASGNIIAGGECNRESLYIAPTIIDGVNIESDIMRSEIFGPLLPVIYYEDLDEAGRIVKRNPDPLALYIFTENPALKNKIIGTIPSGTVCVNDTVLQITSSSLPLGGRGTSGIGSYHGRFGFDTFSHLKSIMERSLVFDVPFRFPPYGRIPSFLKRILEFFS